MKKLSYFCKSNLFNLTLFLELHLFWSLSDNHFGDCLPKKCGELEIQYPFYILKSQNSYCGYPGFEVTCNKNGVALFNLSGDTYMIKNIWYAVESFQVVNSAFVDGVVTSTSGCLDSIKNVSLDKDHFMFAKNHSDMYVFPNCSNKVLEEYKDKRVRCGGVAVDGKDSILRNVEKECNGVVKVPFYDDEGGKSSRVIDSLERGLLLNWKALNCTACRATEGQCGFDVVNNQFNCYCSDRTHALHCIGSPPVVAHKANHMQLVLGLGIGGVVVVLLALIAIWFLKKLRSNHSKSVTQSNSLDRSASDVETGNIYFGVPLFSYKELLEATDNFNQSKELGDGGFGTVYYGKLKDGREVAVKRLYEKSFRRVEQFMNEVQLLTRLRHQNLVSLYGCTSQHSRELLLVYEYVDNGTVADHLYGDKAKLGPLTWPVRLRIAIETASALCYLHASDIIHRDVKTNNILLDNSFKVRVADFGLSRLFPNDVTHVSTAPQGTPGYLDPEYHQFYQLTDKSDVYSFGVVLIELISSLPAIDMERHRHEINLSNYAMNRIQLCAFNELVDPKLGFDSDIKVKRMTTMVAELAFQCLQNDKEFRPTMDEVLEALNRIETSDNDALQTEDTSESIGEVVKIQGSHPPPSPVQDDNAQLLNNHQLHPPSPISVMDKWDSKSSINSHSK